VELNAGDSAGQSFFICALVSEEIQKRILKMTQAGLLSNKVLKTYLELSSVRLRGLNGAEN